MKILKNVLLGIVALIVVLIVAVFIFISTFDLNKYLGPITTQASNALGRQVLIEKAKLSLSLSKGVDLNIINVLVAEDARFGPEAFLKIGQIDATLDLNELIFKHGIVITSMQLSNLHVNIIRDEKGMINAAAIGPKSTESSSTSTTNVATSSSPTIPDFIVRRISIINGVVDYTDKAPDMPMRIIVDKVNVNIDDFSLTQDFPIALQAAVLSQTVNFFVKAKVSIDALKQSAQVKDLSVNSDLALLNMQHVKVALPSLAQMPWPSNVAGALSATLEPINVSAKGLSGVNAKVRLQQLSFKEADITIGLNSIYSEIEMDLSKPDLSGRVDALVLEGEIKDFNVTKALLNQLSAVPVVGPVLLEATKGNLPDLQMSNKTIINGSELKSTIAKGNYKIQKFTLSMDQVSLEAQGAVALANMQVDIPVKAMIEKELSSKLIKSVKQIEGLLNDNGSIQISGRISGIVPKVGFSADVNDIAKKVATSEATNALGEQLDKVIEKNPELGNILGDSSKETIKGLLNSILK